MGAAPDTEVLVIGAGPAGCALALGLARRGVSVVLADSAAVPRTKLCGEFLSPSALAHLGALGLGGALGDSLAGAPIGTVRITAAGAPDLVADLPAPARGVSREVLDGTLAAACRVAGVDLVERWRAVAVERPGPPRHSAPGQPPPSPPRGDIVVVGLDAAGRRQELRARVVAGACGRGERLGERGGNGAAPGGGQGAPAFIAWKMHHAGGGPDNAVELHAFPGGYLGVAPIGGGRVNLCALATRAAFARQGASLDALLGAAAGANPALARRLAGLEPIDARPLAVSNSRFGRRRPAAGPLLLLGDAAAEPAPLSGDGIGAALASAALAASWIHAHLRAGMGRDAMLAGYAASWRRGFGRQLETGDLLQRVLMQPRGAAWALRVARQSPALIGWLIRRTWVPEAAGAGPRPDGRDRG